VIAGPTASGKSSLAVELAGHFQGEIINADSVQVYRGMDVGSAKPSMRERKGIPHHLLDVADPDEDFNAAIYCSLAQPVLDGVEKKKNLCLVVGGTGLYIKALLGGLLECPPGDSALREELCRVDEESAPGFLYEKLKIMDPEAALKIHPNDSVRIIRAIEVMQLTNERLSLLMRKHDFKERAFHTLKIGLQVDREQLYDRINQRSLNMIEKGLVEETESLLQKGYSPDLKAMKSIGYRHVIQFLKGDCDMGEAIRQLQTDTRRYAKRQLTWFRADQEMIWINPEDKNNIIGMIRDFIANDE